MLVKLLISKFVAIVIVCMAASAAPAAPNTGHGAQKTEKECKDDRDKCNKSCDQLIDVDNNIKRCKDKCTDDWVICQPLRSTGTPGNTFGNVTPVKPGMNAPVMRRGIEGRQPGEPMDTGPTFPADSAPETK
ncbi:hypothetical protein W02_03520 [Nitrospira sp. KM1]|uniref:hypothetical protein n=1 Tax=Nitrospira sp. KM1 TaxID=1936990 RepID=UPI0013A7576D|nr:hypothetical protein [Nitrospira sp. KM1]BCA53212.1 hypothetical protein W02_03520 [Nitrospira sp. KM1]